MACPRPLPLLLSFALLAALPARAADLPLTIKPVDLQLPQCTKAAIWSAKPKAQSAAGIGTAQLADLERYTAGDRDPKLCVQYLVIHEGATKDTIKAFATANKSAKPEDIRSTHFVITRAGALIQSADLRRVAWHARNISFWSIGVDLEIPAGCSQGIACVRDSACSKQCTYTPEQYQALDTLITELATRTGITRTDGRILNHCQVFGNGHADTRNLDFTRLRLNPDAHRGNQNYVNGPCKVVFDAATFSRLEKNGIAVTVPMPVAKP